MKTKINLGDKVRDTITGFAGIVIARTEWLHGCERLTVQPQSLHEGKTVEFQSFDAPQLEIITENKAKKSSVETGGPRPEPTRGHL